LLALLGTHHILHVSGVRVNAKITKNANIGFGYFKNMIYFFKDIFFIDRGVKTLVLLVQSAKYLIQIWTGVSPKLGSLLQ